MEDAATCEIAHSQIWQWIKHSRDVLEDGRKVTTERFRTVMAEELKKIRADLGTDAFDRGKFDLVRTVFDNVATRKPLVDFLTLPAYDHLSRALGRSRSLFAMS